MITVGRTTDKHLIRQCMTHPAVWDVCMDDGACAREEFEPVLHDSIVYLGVFEDDEFRGVFVLVRVNHVTWESHTRVLPELWGAKALEACKMAQQWMWDFGAWRIRTSIPSFNSKAIQFAIKSGLEFCGIDKQSWGKNGILYDSLIFGISRGC